MEVEFEKNNENTNGCIWHYGTLTKDNKQYEFSLCEMKMVVGGMKVPSSFEITWIDEEPDNKEEAEKLILESF
ncbi:MAG: hypothetical protein KatS3mg035_0995 [Bacteroidia bacterium]|nr:MAG: hypothetical protein KatS3mg035_0995 [Bacteroidia bacterium]